MTLMQELMQADMSNQSQWGKLSTVAVITLTYSFCNIPAPRIPQPVYTRFTEALNNLNNENPGSWGPIALKTHLPFLLEFITPARSIAF